MLMCACICHERTWGSGGVASLILNIGAGWNEWLASCSGCYTTIQLKGSLCSGTFLVYLFLRFACVSYGRLIAIHYRFNLSTYIQELLVIGGRCCMGRDLNEEM